MQGTRTMVHPARALFLFPIRLVLFVALLLKVAVRKVILGIALVLRAASRNAPAWIAIGLLLGALVLTNYSALAGRPAAALARVPGGPGLASAAAVENYLRGQINADATLMWAAMADELRQSLVERGGSVQQLQESLDRARQAGGGFRDVQYVFGKQLGDGRGIYVYVLTAESPSGETRDVPFMFTVNSSGKIESVD